MIELFKPEDFLCVCEEKDPVVPYLILRMEKAKRANDKLSAYIQCLDKVYGDIKLGSYHGAPLLWSVDEKDDSTHSARLIDLKKIERFVKTTDLK